MKNLTDRMIELSEDIIWAAEAHSMIPSDIIEEYNDLVSLGNMSAIDYFDAKAEMSESEADVIDSLESSVEYSEAVRRANLWYRQNHAEEDE